MAASAQDHAGFRGVLREPAGRGEAEHVAVPGEPGGIVPGGEAAEGVDARG